MELSVYLILILIVIAILSSLRVFFFKNLDIVKEASRYAASFDKFNSYFLEDVKNSKHVKIENTGGKLTIIFDDGMNYIYDTSTENIYRGKTRIASNISVFTINQKTITINNVEKEILSIEMRIGTSTDTAFDKKIDYTLKYW